MRRLSVMRAVECALREAGVAPQESVVIAVSGGVDSMVLLDVLSRLRQRLALSLAVVHVHHGLRGRAADRDAAFVAAEAERRGIPAHLGRLDPTTRRRGESVQMWARRSRYECFDRVAAEVQATRIALGHTRDDQAETVLLHLLRGTGPRGLGGIPPLRGRIVRPLLGVSRREIEAHASARRIRYRTDISNISDKYVRNRLRHHLLPLLEKLYNPRIVESLAALASLMREDETALTAQAASLLAQGAWEANPAVRFPVALLQKTPQAVVRRIFQAAFEGLAPEGGDLTRRHLEALSRLLRNDGRVTLPGGVEARREGATVKLAPRLLPCAVETPPEERQLQPGVWTPWPPLGCRIRVRPPAMRRQASRRPPWQEILRPSLVQAPLRLRAWRAGDRFRPLGMSGEKKLQDFFVDAKIPRHERARIPLLLAGGRIAWVIGHRVAEDFRFEGKGPACLVEVDFPDESAAPKRAEGGT